MYLDSCNNIYIVSYTWVLTSEKKKMKNVRLDQVRCAGAHPHS